MTDTDDLPLAYGDPAWKQEFIAFAATHSGLSAARVAGVVEACIAEVSVGLELIEDDLARGGRILEVGAGIGLLATVLKQRGFDIVALEPGANGFSDSGLIGTALRAFVGDTGLVVIEEEASNLAPAVHGSFDLIFSLNVLEHIPDLEENIAGMERVLAPTGVMVHACPNYHIPYEPHYALPLVPGFPQAVTWLRPSLRRDELWQSLNFITTGRVRRAASAEGLDIQFRGSVLYDTLKRIGTDPVFTDRHPKLFLSMFRFLKQTRLLELLRWLPPSLATPMIFRMNRSMGGSKS